MEGPSSLYMSYSQKLGICHVCRPPSRDRRDIGHGNGGLQTNSCCRSTANIFTWFLDSKCLL